MITITDVAADKAKEILKQEGKEDWGLRIYVAGGGWSISYGLDLAENPLEGDEVIEKNGLKVFIDPYTYRMLSGMELDYVDNGMVAGFVLKGGQQGSSCGSGSCSTC